MVPGHPRLVHGSPSRSYTANDSLKRARRSVRVPVVLERRAAGFEGGVQDVPDFGYQPLGAFVRRAVSLCQ